MHALALSHRLQGLFVEPGLFQRRPFLGQQVRHAQHGARLVHVGRGAVDEHAALGHPALAKQRDAQVGIDHLDDALLHHLFGDRDRGARGAFGLDVAVFLEPGIGHVAQDARLQPA